MFSAFRQSASFAALEKLDSCKKMFLALLTHNQPQNISPNLLESAQQLVPLKLKNTFS